MSTTWRDPRLTTGSTARMSDEAMSLKRLQLVRDLRAAARTAQCLARHEPDGPPLLAIGWFSAQLADITQLLLEAAQANGGQRSP